MIAPVFDRGFLKEKIMLNLDDLPAELLPFKDNILATVKPVIEITLSPAQNLELWTSKVGGKPYLPLEVDYPHNENSEPLGFLAQFNLDELPKTNELPPTGILSFFIDMFEFRCKIFYFENVVKENARLWQNFDQFDKVTQDKLPFYMNPQFAVSFTLKQKPMGYSDFQFDKKVFDDNQIDEISSTIYNSNLFDSTGHHLLGYPYFTQGDPRHYSFFKSQNPDDEFFSNDDEVSWDYILLFQLDTQDFNTKCIMWGDSGVGNFFIHPKDLKHRDFSKVIFYWDCM